MVYALVLAGSPESKVLERIRTKLEEKKFFWLSTRPLDNQPLDGYSVPEDVRAAAAAKAKASEPAISASVPPGGHRSAKEGASVGEDRGSPG